MSRVVRVAAAVALWCPVAVGACPPTSSVPVVGPGPAVAAPVVGQGLLVAPVVVLAPAVAARPSPVDGARVAKEMRALRRDRQPQAALNLIKDETQTVLSDGRVVGERLQALLDLERFRKAQQLVASLQLDGRALPAPLEVALIRMQFHRGDAAGARARMERLLIERPTHVDLRVLRIEMLTTQGRYGEALAEIELLRDTCTEEFLAHLDVDVTVARVTEMMSSDDLLEQSIKLLERAREKRPERADAAGLHVRALSRWQRYERAEEVGLDVLRTAEGGDRADLLYALGFHYRAVFRDEDAIDCFTEALEIQPRHTRAAVGLARCKNRAGDTEAALEILRDLLDTDPNSLDALLALSEIESSGGDFAAAEASLRRILDVKPQHLKALWLLSRTMARQGQLDEVDALMDRYEERKRQLTERRMPGPK